MTPLAALSQAPFAVWLRTSGTAYPLLEVVHILGIALLLGSVLVVDFKLLSAARGAVKTAGVSAAELSRATLWWTVLGFALVATSGSLMLFARLGDLIGNPALLWKFGLITCGFINAVVLHNRNGLVRGDVVSKLQAALSLLIWIGAVTAGRWIAYV
jgi:hypothetical protein